MILNTNNSKKCEIDIKVILVIFSIVTFNGFLLVYVAVVAYLTSSFGFPKRFFLQAVCPWNMFINALDSFVMPNSAKPFIFRGDF